MDFCRRVLRCSSMTAKLAMQGELGLWTLQSRRDLKMLIWWFNVITTDDSRLIKHIYVTGKQIHLSKKKGNWTSMVKKVLIKYNLKPLWDDEKLLFNLDGKGNKEAKNMEDHRRYWRNYIKKHILLYEEEKWRVGIQKKPKLRTLCRFKHNLRLENYLLTAANYQGRRLMTSLRTGTNILEIEKGRWKNLPVQERM